MGSKRKEDTATSEAEKHDQQKKTVGRVSVMTGYLVKMIGCRKLYVAAGLCKNKNALRFYNSESRFEGEKIRPSWRHDRQVRRDSEDTWHPPRILSRPRSQKVHILSISWLHSSFSSSQYIDEDGDVANEFYQETMSDGEKRRLCRLIKNLRPKGKERYAIPRLKPDVPVVMWEVQKQDDWVVREPFSPFLSLSSSDPLAISPTSATISLCVIDVISRATRSDHLESSQTFPLLSALILFSIATCVHFLFSKNEMFILLTNSLIVTLP